MKKAFVFTLALVIIASLFGCNGSNAVKVEDSFILVCSNGELVAPYENFLWSESRVGEHWISADGRSIVYESSEVWNEIPQITYSEDFKIHYRKKVSLKSINLYSLDFDAIHQNAEQVDLNNLPTGEYYLAIRVCRQGKFVWLEGKHESSGYECVYKLIVPE